MPADRPLTIGPWSYRNANLRVGRPEEKLGLGVACVMAVDSFRQEPLTAALASPREDGPSAFCPHPCAETVLTFPCSFRWLVSAFHKAKKFASCELKAAIIGWRRGLSI